MKSGHGHDECNKMLSADSVWRYCHTSVMRWDPLSKEEAWERWIPFATLVEFVQTMSQATQHAQAAFWWPCVKLAFFKSLEVAFERLVPGVAFCVKSRKPLPRLLTTPRTERGHLFTTDHRCRWPSRSWLKASGLQHRAPETMPSTTPGSIPFRRCTLRTPSAVRCSIRSTATLCRTLTTATGSTVGSSPACIPQHR